MKIGINQPYFIPYLGYFGLIKHTDEWIVFDTSQFIDQGWIERNRVLKPTLGWQYIRVPLKKHSRRCKINELEIKTDINWIENIFSRLLIYKNIAPYYKETLEVMENAFSKKANTITEINCNTTLEVCRYLGIEWNYRVFSEMNLNIDVVRKPDEWALNICKSLGYISEYWNLPGGVSFYHREKFLRNNIEIKFYNQILTPYNQKRIPFEPGLSIIDVMMFNSREEINKMLDNYNFI